MRSKILVIGTLPNTAGIGGVTIHIERLLKWLEKRSFSVDLCDYKVLPMIKQINQIKQYEIIHIHASHPVLRLFYVIICLLFGKKSILTIHGDVGRFSPLKNLIDKVAIYLCDTPIVINNKSLLLAEKWNKKTVLMSAFIPPYEDGFVPQYVLDAIDCQRKQGKKIFCTNASARNFTDSGEEIYGIDFLMNYFKDNVGMFLVVSDPSKEYSKIYSQSYDNILFVTEPHSFFAVLKNTDVMIRATATDGDSLSIKEALFLGKRTIATNRVPRPKDVILYEYNDAESLSNAIHLSFQKNIDNEFSENTIDEIVNLYNSMLL